MRLLGWNLGGFAGEVNTAAGREAGFSFPQRIRRFIALT